MGILLNDIEKKVRLGLKKKELKEETQVRIFKKKISLVKDFLLKLEPDFVFKLDYFGVLCAYFYNIPIGKFNQREGDTYFQNVKIGFWGWKSKVRSVVAEFFESFCSKIQVQGISIEQIKEQAPIFQKQETCKGCLFMDENGFDENGFYADNCRNPLLFTWRCRCCSEAKYPFLKNKASQVKILESIANKYHQGRFLRDGKTPYIEHHRAIVSYLNKIGSDDETLAVGWGHDLFEKTLVTPDDLIELGVNQNVIDSIKVLIKGGKESYSRYIKRINSNDMAKTVKLADILIDLSEGRNEKEKDRYSKTLILLGHEELVSWL